MNYYIKLFDGGLIRITEIEYQKLLKYWQTEDKFMLPSSGQLIDKKLVSRILSEYDYEIEKTSSERNKRIKQQEGILHDGIRIIKHFGCWVRADTAHYNNNGNLHYRGTEFDYSYYPEISLNKVKTPEEYSEWLANNKEIPYLPPGNNNIRLNDGLSHI